MPSTRPRILPPGDTLPVLQLLPLFLVGELIFATMERTQGHLSATTPVDNFLWGMGAIQVPWLILCALVPGVVWLAQRLPVIRPQRARALATHAVASVVFAYAHLGLIAATHRYVMHDLFISVPQQTLLLAGAYLMQDVFVYWALVGGLHAWMYGRALQRRDRDAAELRSMLSEARLEALRRQIQPHFLFNTLNTVTMLARTGDEKAVVRVLTDLAGLLRYTLRETDGGVSLGEELEFLRQYIAIEQARFGDRLRVTWDIAPETEGSLLPGLILQPLVENAVRHGLSRIARSAELRLTARRNGDVLVVDIEDNGDGLSPHGREGIGLTNVRDRLAALYGDSATVELRPAAARGTIARVALPFRPNMPRAVA